MLNLAPILIVIGAVVGLLVPAHYRGISILAYSMLGLFAAYLIAGGIDLVMLLREGGDSEKSADSDRSKMTV